MVHSGSAALGVSKIIEQRYARFKASWLLHLSAMRQLSKMRNAKWRKLAFDEFSGRAAHTLAIMGPYFVIFGGFGGTRWDNDGWGIEEKRTPVLLHLDALRNHDLPRAQRRSNITPDEEGDIPSGRYGHSMNRAKIKGKDFCIMFGGFLGGTFARACNELYLLSLQRYGDEHALLRWNRIAVPARRGRDKTLRPRGLHAAAVVRSSNVLYVFGGISNGQSISNFDSLRLNDMDDGWTDVATRANGRPPSPRYGCTMTPVPSGKLIVVGGCNGADFFHEGTELPSPYIFDTEQNTWSQVSVSGPPVHRRCHVAEFIAGHLVILGGFRRSGGSIQFDAGSEPILMREVHHGHWSVSLQKVQESRAQPAQRFGHASLSWGGQILICGGWAEDTRRAVADVYALDFCPGLPEPLRENIADKVGRAQTQLHSAEADSILADESFLETTSAWAFQLLHFVVLLPGLTLMILYQLFMSPVNKAMGRK
eukprot:g2870.t1